MITELTDDEIDTLNDEIKDEILSDYFRECEEL